MNRHFVRIFVRGSDRAKFLHNFCTNNIKAMQPGQLLEAFFVNVQAKVLAHGYVAAFQDHHEIWMLPGDPAALVKHLSRYVISEDVVVELSTDLTHAFCLRAATRPTTFDLPDAESGCVLQPCSGAAVVWVTWNGNRMIVIAGSEHTIEAEASGNAESLESITADQFEQLRISERFPIVGVDLTLENLAPEADRNASSISYTKGCYLGQEPIARIDALGHVNKSLKRIRIVTEPSSAVDAASLVGAKIRTNADVSDDRNIAGVVSSAVSGDGQILGLGIVRVSAAGQPLTIVSEHGQTFAASLS